MNDTPGIRTLSATPASVAKRCILVVHHDADLYGADKSLLRTLRALKANYMEPVLAVPHQGPLVDMLRAEGVQVHIGPVVKLTRQVMKPLAMPGVVKDMIASLRFLSKIVKGRRVSLVYSNSGAVVGGGLWALLHRVPHLWHVREIVVSPKIAARGFPRMFRLLGGWCVCNSHATRNWIVEESPALAARSSVVWNGLEPVRFPASDVVASFREKLGIGSGEVVATLVGRINRWKGQDVLIQAAARLAERGAPGIRILIVGDVADGQHHFREAMFKQIRDAGLEKVVLWHPFTPDVDTVWAASDIAVVPSVWPEPFGRVAIEAMAHSLPVVATRHGGLTEIVEDRVTGLFVAPGNAEELAAALSRLAGNRELRKALGTAGRVRQLAHFSQVEHDRKLLALVDSLSCNERSESLRASARFAGH